MSIRTRRPGDPPFGSPAANMRRKADQQWDLAGLARRDGDLKAAEEHTAKARESEELARLYNEMEH